MYALAVVVYLLVCVDVIVMSAVYDSDSIQNSTLNAKQLAIVVLILYIIILWHSLRHTRVRIQFYKGISTYEVSCSGVDGCGMYDVDMLKSVGERTPPCWTPVLNWHVSMCIL